MIGKGVGLVFVAHARESFVERSFASSSPFVSRCDEEEDHNNKRHHTHTILVTSSSSSSFQRRLLYKKRPTDDDVNDDDDGKNAIGCWKTQRRTFAATSFIILVSLLKTGTFLSKANLSSKSPPFPFSQGKKFRVLKRQINPKHDKEREAS
mgnify:CR=1 FL=1